MAMLGDIKIMMLKGEKGDKGDGSYDDTELRGLIAQETADREAEIAEMERNFLNYLYPVGSIYMSVNSTSPAVLFGGTWSKIENKFLLASGDGHAPNSTGGSETHTPQGTVGDHALTLAETPSHRHKVYYKTDRQAIPTGTGTTYDMLVSDLGGDGEPSGTPYDGSAYSQGTAHSHGFTGTSGNYMPPYLTVNIWKRTA